MNPPQLPSGWELKHPTLSDLQRITDYHISFDIAAFGKPDTTAADIEYEWNRDGFSVERDAWILETPTGEIAGYADYWIHDGEMYIDHLTNIHPQYRKFDQSDNIL